MSLTALESLMEMGFSPKEHCEKALEVSKGSLDAAIVWLSENTYQGNAESASAKGDAAMSAAVESGATSVLDAAASANSASAAKQGGDGQNSNTKAAYKCTVTGKLFRSLADVELYSERTGHTQFEETNEEMKQRSPEELEKAKEELRQRIKQKREARLKKEKEDARQAELKRRKEGKSQGNLREEMLRKKREVEWKKAKKEKLAMKAERERLRAEIARDKAERAARGGKLSGKLGVEGYKPAGQDLNAQKKEELRVMAGIVKKEKVKLPPQEAIEKSVTILSGLKAGGVGATALKTLRKLVGNVLKDPSNPKFRSINLANEAIRKRVTKHPGGMIMLEAVGFQKSDNMKMLLSDADLDKGILSLAKERIEDALTKF